MFLAHPFRRASGLALAGAALLLMSAASVHAQSHGAAAAGVINEMSELFENSCASCHLPPDPDLPTDRAWLNQIKDTA